MISAGRHERMLDRATLREPLPETVARHTAALLQLRSPKLCQGSHSPPFLELRKLTEKALLAAIQEAWLSGVSTRRVDDLVLAMGLSGIGKSTLSKLCRDINERVNAFLDRLLTGNWPYLWLNATYFKQLRGRPHRLDGGHNCPGGKHEGKREVVRLHIGLSEAETFWSTRHPTLRGGMT